jgi:hypothetical protein
MVQPHPLEGEAPSEPPFRMAPDEQGSFSCPSALTEQRPPTRFEASNTWIPEITLHSTHGPTPSPGGRGSVRAALSDGPDEQGSFSCPSALTEQRPPSRFEASNTWIPEITLHSTHGPTPSPGGRGSVRAALSDGPDEQGSFSCPSALTEQRPPSRFEASNTWIPEITLHSTHGPTPSPGGRGSVRAALVGWTGRASARFSCPSALTEQRPPSRFDASSTLDS